MSKILANEIANYGDNAPIDLKEGLNIPAGKPLQAAGSAGSSGQILSSTGTSISWITPFDGSYNSLTNRPTIPAAQINSDWNASSGVAVILNKPSVPPLPSVTTASASGGGSLAYNSGNGQFTFSPADLSNASNWDTAYGWGDHSAAGYLTAEADTLGTVVGRGNTTGGDIRFGDAQKAYFGDSNDLEIYHGGALDNHGYVTSNTGNLYLKSGVSGAVHLVGFNQPNLIVQSTSVQIKYNNSIKLETSNTGVTVTGALTAGGLTYPTTNGTSGQVLSSDGAGNVTWSTPGGLQSRTTALVTQTISNGAAVNLTITTPKTYVLLKVETSAAAWVTLYTDTASRTADAGRALTNDPLPGSGVLAEVITTGNATQLITPGVIGFNSAGSNATYAKVVNRSGSTQSISVTLHYLQLEA